MTACTHPTHVCDDGGTCRPMPTPRPTLRQRCEMPGHCTHGLWTIVQTFMGTRFFVDVVCR
jgi:hypothetical protein